MKTLLEYAKSFLHKPYKWGGDNSISGFDCSGLVQQILKSVGIAPKVKLSSKQLFSFYKTTGEQGKLGAGALCFYGKSLEYIEHVAFMVDEHRVIEAGSGDMTTTTIEEAERRGAVVRMRPYEKRGDFLAAIMPNYPDWVKGE